MQETQVWSLDQEAPLEKGMATHSSVLAWKSPWTEKPGGLQFMGLPQSQVLSTVLLINSTINWRFPWLPPQVWFVRMAYRTQESIFLTKLIIHSFQRILKITNKYPDKEIYRVASRWALKTGASIPMYFKVFNSHDMKMFSCSPIWKPPTACISEFLLRLHDIDMVDLIIDL